MDMPGAGNSHVMYISIKDLTYKKSDIISFMDMHGKEERWSIFEITQNKKGNAFDMYSKKPILPDGYNATFFLPMENNDIRVKNKQPLWAVFVHKNNLYFVEQVKDKK